MKTEGLISAVDSLLVRLARARVVILFGFHAAVFSAAYVLAYLARFEGHIPDWYLSTFRGNFGVVVGVQLVIGLFFGFYRGWWRYVGIGDVTGLAGGLSAALAVGVGLWYLGPIAGLPNRFCHSPRGVLLTDWAFALLMLFAARVIIRLSRDHFSRERGSAEPRKRVVIIGTGDTAEILARQIQHRPQMGMRVVAFIDDDRAKIGSHIRGVRVRGPVARVVDIARSLAADEVLIANPRASGAFLRQLVRNLTDAGLAFRMTPPADQLITGGGSRAPLRPLDVEDLLRRQPVELPGDPVRALLHGRRVMLTGAGGSIGSELASQILRLEPESLSLVERSEFALYEIRSSLVSDSAWATVRVTSNLADITDAVTMESLIAAERPELVIHAAAHKHVPLGEENPPEYVRNNTLATRQLAEICARNGVERFVFVSSDKAINPSSVMGASKRAAEVLLLDVAAASPMRVTIVRFGNVVGSSGSVVPLFMQQIAAGGPVTVTHPQATRYFIRKSEAVSLVLQAATLGEGADVFMLDMGEPVPIVELARDLIRLCHRTEAEVSIVFTGLRPGEKVFEEISLTGESVRPTIHPHIVATKAVQPRSQWVQRWLAAAATMRTADQAVAMLRDLVPEYQPRIAEAAAGPAQRSLPVVPAVAYGG